MSTPIYDEYKDTNVPWLGSVPKHWVTRPLWTLFRRTKRVGNEDLELLSVYRDYGVVPKASREDNFNKPSDDLSTYQLVEPSDLVINKMKAWQGSVAISDYRGIVSPAYHVYESKHSQHSKFLHYLMRSPGYITGYLSLSKGIRVNQWDLEPQHHSRMPVLLPPIDEQRSIAAFLDAETSKIDALVAEQRRLIELLKEKRQAVISHAVTKGLNPHVKMKPSGIDWLGDVPEHWEVLRAKNVSDIFVPQRNKPDLNEERIGLPWITMEQMKQHYIIESSLYVSELASKESGSRALRSNSVIASCVGQFGIAAVNTREVIINQQLQAYIPTPRINSDFFKFLIEVSAAYFERVSTAATLSYVNQKGFERLPLALPDTLEQVEIVECLKNRLHLVDSQIITVEQAICLLQERRTALISAAVTGKIDVRGFAPKKASE